MTSNKIIKIKIPLTWQFHHYEQQGYYRFKFVDGGILDWYAHSTGRLEVRGKEDVKSYQALKKPAPGKSQSVHGAKLKPKNHKDIPRLLKIIEERLVEILPNEEITLETVFDVGWEELDQQKGASFRFTDGTILNYYKTTKTLSIQGRSTIQEVQKTLQQLPSPIWLELDQLRNYLEQLFPDWEMGRIYFQKEAKGEEGIWTPQTNALDWQAFWSENWAFRQAANGNEKAPCQRAFLEDWSSVLAHEQGLRALLAQAPTGLGKTLSALVPALAWVAENPDQRRVYYLVNRLTQHDNPIRELRKLDQKFLQKTGQSLRVVDLVGRSHLCIEPNTRKISSICKQSREKASFSHIPDQLYSWQDVQQHFHKDDICPYHFLQGLMSQAHIVICDYWWLFSEIAQQSQLLNISGIPSRNSIVIVDEAHNLPLRVRAELDVEENFADIKRHLDSLETDIQKCLKPVLQYVKEFQSDEAISPSNLLPLAGGRNIIQSFLNSLNDNENTEQQLALERRILQLLLKPDSDVVFYWTKDNEENSKLICKLIDPTPVLSKGYSLVHSSLTMSGTLAAPTDDADELGYQISLFGLPKQTLTRRYLSPFPLKNQQWIYVPDTYGTYLKRDSYISNYVQHITEIGKATPGITVVFFNSYQFLQKVLDAITEFDPEEHQRIVTEERNDLDSDESNSQSLESYRTQLERLNQQHQRGYLFAVYQGKIAEGANFPGNLIKSIICISVPLEYPSLFHEKLKERYQVLFETIANQLRQNVQQKAEEYAIRRLALSLVLQACGRGIRSENDRCSFVLLDYRYGPGTGGYDWRGYLSPPPYNLSKPSQTVENFHSPPSPQFDAEWDSAILNACQGDIANAKS